MDKVQIVRGLKEKFLLQLNCSHGNIRARNFFSGRIIIFFWL